MPKEISESDQARGRRFKAAAMAKGYRSARMGELVGVEDGTVRGYWRGLNVPAADKLNRYAEKTGVPVGWLLYGTERDRRLWYADLIASGVDPTEALERVFMDVPQEERQTQAWAVSDAERDLLSGAGEAMRAEMELASGGQWDRLTDEQKDLILRLIGQMVPRGSDSEPR